MKRQAYHSHSFVGNHIHICLQVHKFTGYICKLKNAFVHTVNFKCCCPLDSLQDRNIEKLCNAVINVTRDTCPQLLVIAQDIKAKYHKLFSLFAKCHFKINSSKPMKEPEIEVLGKYKPGLLWCI